MAIRDFIDDEGTEWRVWSTTPYTAAGVAGTMKMGWLTFDSVVTRRRLVPIPADWEDVSDAQLGAYCREAIEVGRTPHAGNRTIDSRAD